MEASRLAARTHHRSQKSCTAVPSRDSRSGGGQHMRDAPRHYTHRHTHTRPRRHQTRHPHPHTRHTRSHRCASRKAAPGSLGRSRAGMGRGAGGERTSSSGGAIEALPTRRHSAAQYTSSVDLMEPPAHAHSRHRRLGCQSPPRTPKRHDPETPRPRCARRPPL